MFLKWFSWYSGVDVRPQMRRSQMMTLSRKNQMMKGIDVDAESGNDGSSSHGGHFLTGIYCHGVGVSFYSCPSL